MEDEQSGVLAFIQRLLTNTHGITPQGGGVPLSQLRQLGGDPGSMPGVGTMTGPARQGLIGLLKWIEANTDKLAPSVARGQKAIPWSTPWQGLDNVHPYGGTLAQRGAVIDPLIDEQRLVNRLMEGLGPAVER